MKGGLPEKDLRSIRPLARRSNALRKTQKRKDITCNVFATCVFRKALLRRASRRIERRSLPGAPPSYEITARWQPTNPNVLTVVSSSGSAIETKVTKRSFQQPFDGAFGTSESARVVEVGSEGESSTMPKRTERVQTKYKWDATGGGEALQIEAIELAQTFDASESDSADPAGATPVLTVKTRLLFTRQRPEDQNFP